MIVLDSREELAIAGHGLVIICLLILVLLIVLIG